ncbi:uncharacterized protein EI90DRAFT_2948021 [Cantharellus anzutake]|uniref:uncharacterized protein n=1 Tax=Cantharellus anzutake TaxID=1750568 RepID=UPI001908560B|nr:uncharacterized protein EI90DRAFT_2948021 [Cantharellus anzutake]KAF8314588.1 hypothetical protein EI90DRAFT_2948021 [Cantharellus anzutake]
MQQDGNGLERYRCDQTCQTLQQFGIELASGSVSQFGGITHINNNHWIAFLISPVESTIYVADSLRQPTEDNGLSAVDVLQWWLAASYSSPNKSVLPFQIAWLPIAYQKDSISCGLLALNALMHHLIPTKYSLCTNNNMVMLHVKFLTSILDHHDKLVSGHVQQ